MKRHTTESATTPINRHDIAHSPLDDYQRIVAGGPPNRRAFAAIRRLPIGLRLLAYTLGTLFTAGIIAGLVISLLG
ncbi:hypothetical protein ITJ88_06580 [Exiguobacterium sp. TBG-PICH-001]|uniref:hypothetical protein n=1 Tax=Exiguobacterium abrahamii TaxID=2785532 RepID=UPI0018A77D37|nr:hypothetical protein [Exiguobacterium sp. TBG-PICH-001]MBF8152949.1 hypothetical protein [Exiguobacterium sp. TBG-PICH-001]